MLTHRQRQNIAYRMSRQLPNGPCEVCGATEKVAKHHDDYAAMTGVTYLCKKHHLARHKELGWGIGGRPKGSKNKSKKS